MKKLKGASFCFHFIDKIVIRKFYFIVLISAVAIFTNGFFISRVSAETVTENFVVVSGTDASGVPEPLTTADIERLAISDNESMLSNVGWPSNGTYDENKYLEFEFNPIIPENANITNVTVTNEYYRSGTLLGAKLELENGIEIELSLPPVVGYPGEVSGTVDITEYVDSPIDLQNFKIKFLAYRSGGITTTKTGHDFIGLTVNYELGGTGVNNFTEVTENITEDTNWIKSESPYVVNFPLNIDSGVTLHIEDGVIVKFGYDGGLIVEGTIEAGELGLNEIYFTSLQDDTVGGDTNNDGENSYPIEGDWGYIIINGNNSSAVFNNVIQRYSEELGLILYDGGVINSDGYNSDGGVLFFGSESNMSDLEVSFVEIYDESEVSIDGAEIFSEEERALISMYNNSTLVLFDSQMGGNNSYLVDIANYSHAQINNVLANNNYGYGSVFSVYDNSSLSMDDGFISTYFDGFEIYGNSIFDLTNTSILCGNNGISVYDHSTMDFIKGNILCLNDGFILFNEASANITEVKVSNAIDSGLLVFNNYDSAIVNISKSEITANNYGFVMFDSKVLAHQNSIHDNLLYGAFTSTSTTDLDFTENYWGDESGPTHITNPDGTGDIISDNILYDPFLKNDPTIVKNPVIIIPGITGTYLFKNYDDYEEIWPNLPKLISSLDDSFLNDLALLSDGTEDPEKPIVTGDIIRGVSFLGVHVFDKLITELINNGGYVENENLFVFPYDWRKSTTENSLLLKEKIDEIILNTGSQKVDIIAHSMGGLVAKKYVAEFLQNKVDNLIFLGTPQLGAPKAFKVLMYGDNMNYGLIIFGLNPNRAKYISQNMPAVYELLPSQKYVGLNKSYIRNELNTGTNGEMDLGYEETKELMIEDGRNEDMYPFAEDLHESIDDLDISGLGIDAYNFIGCGERTIGHITLKKKKLWKNLFFGWGDDYSLKYVSGDGTIPLVSANKDIGTEQYYVTDASHGSLPSTDGVKENILLILKGEELQSFPNISTTASDCGISGNIISTHSPVELHIYDEEGNHTGPNINGDVEYNIPNVQYDQIKEENYAFLPDNLNYKIITKATDIGGYSFMIENQDKNENILNTYKWTLIPLKTLNSSGEIWVGPSYPASNYSIKMDQDGDGNFDDNYLNLYDGTDEAEKFINDSNSKTSGSIILSSFEKPKIEIPTTYADNFDYKEVLENKIINKNNQETIVEENKIVDEGIQNKNNLSASALNSGVKVDLLLPIIILFGLIGLILAKIFLKL